MSDEGPADEEEIRMPRPVRLGAAWSLAVILDVLDGELDDDPE
ncbi:hypothetical protein [Microbacterium panaciterrae]|uniref:Uncharacterized protein n=1 Tax=Microbacterium panaciterrae TaxID=985759 RepID=A0ABP8PKT7_9MICO